MPSSDSASSLLTASSSVPLLPSAATDSLIEFILHTSYAQLPQAALADAQRALLDTLGVAVAGRQTALAAIIHQQVALHFGGKVASLWGDEGQRASAAGAALANAMTIDSLDAHDGHKLTKGHVGCGLIPAVIALCEAERVLDSQALLSAIVIGYEVGTRAGIALHQSACDYHTSGAWISVAVAAVGARLLRLNAEQTRHALGIAEYHGPRSQMMRCIDHPTMLKDGSGWGAMAGVVAAYLARDGFTGAPALTFESADLSEHWADLGQRWYIQEQYIKLYPVCRWAQPAVEAVIALQQAYAFEPAAISQIRIESFAAAKRLSAAASNTEQAQYSLPFAVAAALVCGSIGVSEVSEPGLQNGSIQRLSACVSIEVEPSFEAAFPAKRFARAQVVLQDGSMYRSPITEAKGDPEQRLPQAVIEEKFHRLTEPTLGGKRASELKGLINALLAPESLSIESLLMTLRQA